MSNAYYDALAARPDTHHAYSLRGPGPWINTWCTHDPVEDALKVVIPAFYAKNSLTAPMNATTDILPVTTSTTATHPQNMPLRVDTEIMTVVTRLSSTQIRVTRGTHGTVAAPHPSGTTVFNSTNSLQSQVRLPFGTSDNHEWVCIWDVKWSDAYRNIGSSLTHKFNQFGCGGSSGDQIWLEPRISYGNCGPNWVGSLGVRSYNSPGEIGPADWSQSDGNQVGPGATWSGDTIGPRASFCLAFNTWTRFFWRLQQKAQDYDPVALWVADETRDPVQVLFWPPVSVRPSGKTPNVVANWWIEENSSTDALLRPDQRNFVNWVRNAWMGKDVQNFDALLIRPDGGIPPQTPTAPTNVTWTQL